MPSDSTDSRPAKSCSDHASHSRTLFLSTGAGVVLSRMLAVSLHIRNSGHCMAIPFLKPRYASQRPVPAWQFPLCSTSGLLQIVPSLGVGVPLGNPAGRELRTGLRLTISGWRRRWAVCVLRTRLLAVRWVLIVYVGVLIEVSMLIGRRVCKVRKCVSHLTAGVVLDWRNDDAYSPFSDSVSSVCPCHHHHAASP